MTLKTPSSPDKGLDEILASIRQTITEDIGNVADTSEHQNSTPPSSSTLSSADQSQADVLELTQAVMDDGSIVDVRQDISLSHESNKPEIEFSTDKSEKASSNNMPLPDPKPTSSHEDEGVPAIPSPAPGSFMDDQHRPVIDDLTLSSAPESVVETEQQAVNESNNSRYTPERA